MVPRCVVSDNVKAEVCLNRTQTMWMATLEDEAKVCFYKKGPRRVYLSNRCNDTHFQAVFPWHIKTDNCAKRKNSLSEKYNPCLLSYLCTPVKVGMFVQFLVSKSSKIFGYSNNNSYQKGVGGGVSDTVWLSDMHFVWSVSRRLQVCCSGNVTVRLELCLWTIHVQLSKQTPPKAVAFTMFPSLVTYSKCFHTLLLR